MISPPRFRQSLILVAVSLALGMPGHAHDDPVRVVDTLTTQLVNDGITANRLIRRATVLRMLGDLHQATHDLQYSVEQFPYDIDAYILLADIQLDMKQPDMALKTAELARSVYRDDPGSAELYRICGDAHVATNNLDAALTAYSHALNTCPNSVDWHLRRNDVLAKLGRHAERAKRLESAHRSIPSIVLYTAWIDALIANGNGAAAMHAIAPELAKARLQSSWLLRRARAHRLLNNTALATADLKAALLELDARLTPHYSAPALLLDRAEVLLMLGQYSVAAINLRATANTYGDSARYLRIKKELTRHLEPELTPK